MSEFKIGDRVRVKRAAALHFILPLRKWVEDGRAGSIVHIRPDMQGWAEPYKVRFDTKRAPKRQDDYEAWFPAEELEIAP